MKKFLKSKVIFIIYFIFFVLNLFFLVNFSLAQQTTGAGQLKALGGKAGYDTSITQEEDVVAVIGKIIYAILGIIGIVFLIFIVYGGWLWMTARGNEEQVGKAKKIIINATIGIVIIITSYALTWFIMSALGESTGAIY
jgi:hypothetical protein